MPVTCGFLIVSGNKLKNSEHGLSLLMYESNSYDFRKELMKEHKCVQQAEEETS